MDNQIIFIMCQGQKDFNAHFLKIGDETILSRTLRMVDGYKVVVVANRSYYPRICPSSYSCVDLHTLTNPTYGLLRGVSLTIKDFVFDRAIILLGDVIYSNRLMNVIKYDSKEFRLFGRMSTNIKTRKLYPEILALSISNSFISVFQDWATYHWLSRVNSSLWSCYNRFGGMLDLRTDYSDDIDSELEYNTFFNKIESCALSE